jgi:NAD(P)-dependent dehydrogenase (short-subunit alcohol dehydrogenase family)
LARSAAAELGVDGIRVNCVCPGAVDTPMLAPVVAFPEWREDILRRTPLGRLAQPEEIADAIVFLLGDQSRFITGTSLTVDGGMTAIGGL